VPIEHGTPGDCETSTKPIVLVNRVTTGAPRSIELRLRVWNDGRFPLPFTATIPVSFERSEGVTSAPLRQLYEEQQVRPAVVIAA
jgi:hypothetical protein